MAKHFKKVLTVAMAAVMTTTMAVSASASTIATADPVSTPYGNLNGELSVTEGFWFWDNSKTFTATTTCTNQAPTLTVSMEVVSYPSGASIYSGSNRKNNATSVSVSSEGITKSDTVTVYGAHQEIDTTAKVTYSTATAV